MLARLNLGKHWIVVLTIGAVLTVGLGYGITKLEFSTGQDSYLNKSDQVYKDNVAYQKLFGGQAMLTLVTMDKGHTVTELFTPDEHRAVARGREEAARQRPGRQRRQPAHRAPVQRRARAGARRATRPRASRARSSLGAIARDKTPAGQAARNADAAQTLARLTAIPPAERTLDNPKYVDFLLHDNQGKIRKPLLAFFPDDRHAQMVTRLPGNQSIKDEGTASDLVTDAAKQLALRQRADHHHRRARCCSRTSTTTSPAACSRSAAIAIAIMIADPARCCSACAGGCSRSVIVLIGVDLGVRHRRLPRHPAHDRHDRRPAR